MKLLLCGLRVASDLPLPDLLPWTGEDGPPDLEIRLGPVPQRIDSPAHSGPLLQVSPTGTCRLAIPGVAAYLAVGGHHVTVEPEPGADASAVRLFLLGTMLAFVCHQRGLLPLHAACVEIAGQAVALTGASGAGKSTLAAAFLRRGYRILADDVTVVDVPETGVATVVPSFPRINLWEESIDGLGWSGRTLDRVRDGIEKFGLPLDTAFRPDPLPLAAIYHLVRADTAEAVGVTRLRGAEAVRALLAGVARQRRAFEMGCRAAIMQSTIRIAPIPSFRLSRMLDLATIDATVDAIVARH